MRVLVIENYGGTGLGQVGTALDDAKAEIDYIRPHARQDIPASAAGHDALIVLGGAQNALDDEGSPHFPRLLDLIRDFEGRDRAVLGICLGSQLIARAFGGENRIGGHREFGWHEIALTEAAATDPVFSAVSGRFPIFQWHDDSFSLPQGAVHLASGEKVANQAYRVGRAVYATQFHFEADRKLVAQWNREFAELIAKNEPDWPARHEDEAARHGPAADAAGLVIARAWIATV